MGNIIQADFKLPIFKREYVEHDEINKGFMEAFEEIEYVFSDISVQSRFGEINMKFDWSELTFKARNALSRNYSLEDYVLGRIPDQALQEIQNHISSKNPEKDIVTIGCDIALNNNVKQSEKNYRIATNYLDNTLIHFFLAMNLSTPGMLHCFCRELQSNNNFTIYNFSSADLEYAWMKNIENGWPGVKKIALNKTYDWLSSINIGQRQIANKSIERALYAILHVCVNQYPSPTQIIWVSLALEALYETPKAQINKKLINRIFLFLGVPENNYNKFKKQIGKFYNLRSRFVHGEMDISVPFPNNVLDDSIWEHEGEVLDNVSFGLSIVIATIQKMIINNWKSLSFS